jgi:hypothetical protein
VLEPISPELVLVDPELRRKVLAQLLESLLLEALPEPAPRRSQTDPAPRPVEPAERLPRRPASPMPLSEVLRRPGYVAAKPRRKRRLAPALLPVSIAVNVIVIALSVSDARIARTSPSSPLAIDPPTPSQLAPPTTKPPTKKAQRPAATTQTRTARKSKPGAPKRSATVRETRGKVEQKVLNTVIQSPAGKLPRALIDSRTGLAKSNLQAVCRLRSGAGFLCLVRPAQHRTGEGLYVAYKPGKNGKGTFKWYSYRSGT